MRKKWYRPSVLALLLAVLCSGSGQPALTASAEGMKESKKLSSAEAEGSKGSKKLSSAEAEGSKESGEAFSADAEELKEDAKQVVSDMLAGNFGDITKEFDETMKAALSEEALKASWDSVAVLLGEPGGIVSVESMEVSGSYVCVVTQAFENSSLQIQISYNEDGKISGLYMRPVSAVQEQTDAGDGEESGDESQTDAGEAKEPETEVQTGSGEVKEPETEVQTGLGEEETAEGDEYEEFELTVAGDPSCPLGAALTLPRDVEKPPVVILVQGSGSSDRDERVGDNRPFADIAHGLAQRGIAVLRYDKRFFTYPERGMEISDLNLREEYLDDVSAAIVLMQEEERVDGSRIFVLGHSLGGSLVPAVAAEHPELSGIISMAGSLRPLWEISYDQNQELLSTMDRDSLPEEQQELLETQTAQLEADMAVLRGDGLDEQPADASLLGLPACYWQSIKEYCGMNFIDEVEMPILVLQGDADFQVFPDKDYVLWQETLEDRENVEFHLYEGLNHLMMKTQGKRDVSEYETAGHVDAQVIEDIAAFVKTAA